MIRLIAVAFALAVATSAQAMSPPPLHQMDGMITHIGQACGAGQVRSKGNCVLRTTNRPVKSGDGYRRCAAWSEGFCVYLGCTKLRRSSGIHALSVNPRAFVLYL